ncbi:MAG: hypothetical protein IPM42_21850 [Saprospiraceae bacterium]|nr:hypothetical protein [Saprospiraceae bacterium]
MKTIYLWVPKNTSNRTSFLSGKDQRTEVNYQGENEHGVYNVAPFPFWEEDNKVVSENQNCLTPYELVEVPEYFTQNDLYAIGGMIAAKTGYKGLTPSDCIRAISISNISLIKEILTK